MGGGARRIRARAPLNSAVSARQRTPRERIRAREKPDVGPRVAAMPAELQGTLHRLRSRCERRARRAYGSKKLCASKSTRISLALQPPQIAAAPASLHRLVKCSEAQQQRLAFRNRTRSQSCTLCAP